jgi:uncharacterized Zn-finger protein
MMMMSRLEEVEDKDHPHIYLEEEFASCPDP